VNRLQPQSVQVSHSRPNESGRSYILGSSIAIGQVK